MTSDVRVRIAHLSDPHFGTVVPAVRDALLAESLAHPPDLILMTGDITQRARRSQFAEAREFLNAMPHVPRLCMPGNHDLPLFDVFTRALNPYAHFRTYISTELQPEFIDERVAVLFVDATRRTRHKNGVLSDRQIDRTAARLADQRAPFRLVATHQPLAALVASDRSNVARGAPRALDRWIAAGADMFIGGHIHLPYCIEVRTTNLSDSSVLLQAGTCLSHRVRDGIPNSYNILTLHCSGDARSIGVERRDFDAATGRFAVARRYEATSAMDQRRTGSNGWRLETP